jgi:hypothetical protein
LKFSKILDNLENFGILEMFGNFGNFIFFGNFGNFGIFWKILGFFGKFWDFLENLGSGPLYCITLWPKVSLELCCTYIY